MTGVLGKRVGMSGPPNMHHVAELAGVSIATVSNVLNHPERVTRETRRKVDKAIDELGFTLNQTARALKSGNARTVGLVVIDLTNSLFVDIARGAQQRAHDEDLTLQLASANNESSIQEAHLAFFDSARASGVILAPMVESDEMITRVRRHGRPVVLVNFDSYITDSCRVLVDNEEAGYIGVRHLIQAGRKRIAFVAAQDELQPVHRRRLGARRAVFEAGAGYDLLEIGCPDLTSTSGAAIGEQLATLSPAERPNAVLAVTDILAMAVINAVTAAGLRVPEDVAVMGCDHNSAAWGGAIPLTSVAMQGEEMGRAAMDLLFDEMRTPAATHVHRRVVLRPQLVVRESTVGR